MGKHSIGSDGVVPSDSPYSDIDPDAIDRAAGIDPDALGDMSAKKSFEEGGRVVGVDPNNPNNVIVRTKKKHRRRSKHKKKKLSTGKKVAIGIVIAIVVLLIAAAIVVALTIKSGNDSMHNEFEGAEVPSQAQSNDNGQTISYNGHTYAYNEDVVSVLFLGKDDESDMGLGDRACADVNILLTMDTKTNAINIIVIPRDTQVDVDLFVDDKHTVTKPVQLCLAYGVDVYTEEERAENSLKSVRRIFYGLPIEQYFSMNDDAFTELIDAIGGVSVTALEDLPAVGFTKGEDVLLTGTRAFDYVHYRDTAVDGSDVGRRARQMQVIKAFVDQARHCSLKELLNLRQTISDNSTTNLSVGDISYLASCFLAGNKVSTNFTTLTGTIKMMKDDDGEKREHTFLDKDVLFETTLNAFYKQID